MAVSVNDYSSSGLTGGVYSKYSTNSIDTNVSKDDTSSYLDFDGYLQLLTAQMSNQDFNNAMSDSEFIQQMASYSMMEAISQLTQQNALSYSSSLIGKAVTVSDGTSFTDTGIVEAVTVTSDGCKLLVNGNQYSAESITDVIDGDVFTKLNSFVGHTVEVKDGDETVTGKVTGIVIKNGDGFVVLENNTMYALNSITNVIADETTGTDDTDNSEGTGTDGIADSENTGSTEVNQNTAAYALNEEYSGVTTRNTQSQASYDALMRMLDDTSDSNQVTAAATVENSIENLSRYLTTQVDQTDASSGLTSDSSRIPAPVQTNSSTQNNSQNAQQSTQMFEQTRAKSSQYDKGDVYGVTSVADSAAESSSLEQYSEENSYYDIAPSTRKYAEDYPLEAAFADQTRTRMTDIRFIGNTDINSRIDTSELLCYSAKGRAVTDLGWSGKGLLGEVVTYADGTQRVEIIGPTEVSYLYTTGNYTLDELCDQNVAPGALAGKLSGQELAIRHYAREYSASEQAEMNAFGEFCARHAYTNNLG